MLQNIHVKNMALIDEADVDFGDHLNILTGETGLQGCDQKRCRLCPCGIKFQSEESADSCRTGEA